MKSLSIPIAIAIAACGHAVGAAENPVTLKLTDLEARVLRIERVVENQSLVQLASELDQLKEETKALRGDIEKLRYETESANARQRELYVDVDRRLQALESAPRQAAAPPPIVAPSVAAAPAPAPAPAPERVAPPPQQAAATPATAPAAQRPSGTDQQNYQAAFELIQARKYPEATKAFNDFLAAFPTSPLADNAQYWLGETYYVQRQFMPALAQFQKIVDQYPGSSKLGDALLKIGYCQNELGDKAAAQTTFEQVIRKYPNTTAARLAAQRLDR
jgi:tol-pal system protein YbgF